MKKFIKKPPLAAHKISRASSPGRTSTALDDLQSQISLIDVNTVGLVDTGEPVGFKSRLDSTISVNDASRTLTIAPSSGSYTCYVGGKKLVITSPRQAVWNNTHGSHFFYIDENSDLKVTTTFTDEIITKYAFVSVVYWDLAAQQHIYFAEERHGINMMTQTHLYLHNTRGAQFDNGLGLTGFSVDGSGNLAAHAQFTSKSGTIWDEDLKHLIPAQTQLPVFYRLGTVWKRKAPDSFPVIYNGTAGYSLPRLPYNAFDGTNWSLAQVDSNKFVLVHVFATNDIQYPVIAVQGQAQYISKSAARTGAQIELQQLSGLPFAEFAPLGSVIYQTQDVYSNTPKAIVVSTDLGDNYEDHRGEVFRPSTLN